MNLFDRAASKTDSIRGEVWIANGEASSLISRKQKVCFASLAFSSIKQVASVTIRHSTSCAHKVIWIGRIIVTTSDRNFCYIVIAISDVDSVSGRVLVSNSSW